MKIEALLSSDDGWTIQSKSLLRLKSKESIGRPSIGRPSLDEAYRKRQNEDDRLIVPDPSLSGYLKSDSLETGQLTTRSPSRANLSLSSLKCQMVLPSAFNQSILGLRVQELDRPGSQHIVQSTFSEKSSSSKGRTERTPWIVQRSTGFDFVKLQSIPAPFAIQSRNYGSTAPKDRAVDVSGSKVSPPPAAVGMVSLSLPV
ncbi:hypothetical protein Acr_00g0004310 [Actinidia rufa]|uniref:Uncharacterized protein n=1 Tax=Actinidia rufa TaxID=165716 RepID=A0A7J0D7G2_9ERIC|nr:hypothetical protein Acr_00g0004310 [Actinidia rufa]